MGLSQCKKSNKQSIQNQIHVTTSLCIHSKP